MHIPTIALQRNALKSIEKVRSEEIYVLTFSSV